MKSHHKSRKFRKKDLKRFVSLFFCTLNVFHMLVPVLFTASEKSVSYEEVTISLTSSMMLYRGKSNENKEQKEIITEKESAKSILKKEILANQEVIKEKSILSLEEMQADPLTLTLDFLPHLKGTFEENCEWMAKVIYIESRGNSDLEQQLQGLVLIARAFYPGGKSFSDGTGSLKSAIFGKGQYPWAKEGDISWVKPDEQAYRNAEAVLTGNVLDIDLTKNITRNVVYANTVPQGSGIYTTTVASNEKTVYFCYV